MSLRKEYKYRLSYGNINLFKEKLLRIGMEPLFKGRTVNSLYFDTKDFSMFSDSEEGILPRKKIRVRWYDAETSFSKETKISSVEGRFKTSKKISDISSISQVLSKCYVDEQYGFLRPVLFITYHRKYYVLNQLRITFDQNILYKSPNSLSFLYQRDTECVAEVKAPIDCGSDYIQKIISQPSARFSKYSRGMLEIGQLL
jgi:hypothetical protein